MAGPTSGAAPRVLVFGDLCVDTIVSTPLPLTWSAVGAAGEPLLRVPIDDRIGGTAYQFAQAAARFGLHSTIVGSVGQDPAGDLIVGRLASLGIDHQVQRSATAPTARSMLAYDAGGARLMFTSSVNANDELSADFSRAHTERPWDLCWLSGLCLRSRTAPRFRAAVEGVARARDMGAMVLLDLVPHTFHRLFTDLPEVTALLGGLDGVVADLAAARKMIGLPPSPETPPAAALLATADALLEVVPFAVLQWHDNTTYHQLAVSRSRFRSALSRPVPQGGALVGYGDSLAAECVRDFLVFLTDHADQVDHADRPAPPRLSVGGRNRFTKAAGEPG